ncbi:MAG: nitroreductase family protein [Candidatus Shapirobacteria bacterium]|jgi:nitroreductase
MKEIKTFWQVVMGRKSVRNFKPGEIGKEELLQIIKAGMAAPSAINLQPWEVVAVTERETLDKLGKAMPFAKMLYQASAAIIVCGKPKGNILAKVVPVIGDYWVMDCSAMSENMLLAAEALGLGAVWTSVFPSISRAEEVRKILEIPDWVIPLNVIPIGIPARTEKPKDKYREEKIHWEKW